jgi:hypothetical protein
VHLAVAEAEAGVPWMRGWAKRSGAGSWRSHGCCRRAGGEHQHHGVLGVAGGREGGDEGADPGCITTDGHFGHLGAAHGWPSKGASQAHSWSAQLPAALPSSSASRRTLSPSKA